jgi:formate hydrogenlyase subunit 4
MVLIRDLSVQGIQMMLVLLLAPLLTGIVRKVKARLVRRQGPPLIQPYRDLIRLMRKDAVLAVNASWLFRAAPYLVFAATWVAAALVPTFATGLLFSWSADLIAIIALLGSARFFLALAGMDVGTSFGGIGSSREAMIASLAEPAMIMIDHRRVHAVFGGGPQSVARLGAHRSHPGGDRGEFTYPGRQPRDPSRTHDGA